MFEREMVIQGLRKQRMLLEDLIVEIEQRPAFDLDSLVLTEDRAKLITRNLRKLRKIKDNYMTHRQTESLS